MCGRYASTRSAADLTALFEAVDEIEPSEPLAPSYNLAPTDPAPFVRVSRERGTRVLAVGRWGLLPHWARDPRQGARMINARVETVATAPAYASAFATRRALVPADGWYEWRRLDGSGSGSGNKGGKQAYFMTPADGSALAFAGLWSRWGPAAPPGGDGPGARMFTFCVITVPARGDLVSVHDRMPLVLPRSRWERWLAGESPPLDPPPAELLAGLELRPVGPAVGNVRNEGPDLVTRVDVSGPPAGAAETLF
jgi:putative SOS response-associated peptidase YedK